jgi:DNA-directed RNA polymerase specialized sigma24 family protein
MTTTPSVGEPASDRGSFPTTRWSIVVNAGAGSESESRAALEMLCRQYWYPLYGFIRRQGRTHHEAQDCTQEFFARLLANDGFATARPERGRFRTFLLTSLRNFLAKEWHRAHAAKRGGEMVPLSLDLRDAQDRFAHEPVEMTLGPEQAFDRTWALGMIERSIGKLQKEYEKSGRGELFAALVAHVWGNGATEAFAAPAARLGMTAHAFTVALHRLRQRVGHRLRADVAETVASESEVDEELRHLIAAVSTRPSAS